MSWTLINVNEASLKYWLHAVTKCDLSQQNLDFIFCTPAPCKGNCQRCVESFAWVNPVSDVVKD